MKAKQTRRQVPATGTQARRPLVERFWEKVNKDGPLPSAEAVAVWPEIKDERCWIFGVAKRGMVWLEGRNVLASRVAWFLETGKWPEPNCLHKCDRGACVRPSHLFEGTQEVNIADMLKKRRGNFASRSKLTEDDVREIRRLGAPCIRHPWKRGTALLKKRLAKRFGTTTQHIDAILKNEKWRQS